MDVMEEARQAFARGGPLWPLPLIHALDARGRGPALDWAERCCELLLPLAESDDREALASDLKDFARYRERGADEAELTERMSRIWYGNPGPRDDARRAVAKLYEALAIREIGDGRYALAVASPVAILTRAARRPDESFERVIREFRRSSDDPLPSPESSSEETDSSRR